MKSLVIVGTLVFSSLGICEYAIAQTQSESPAPMTQIENSRTLVAVRDSCQVIHSTRFQKLR